MLGPTDSSKGYQKAKIYTSDGEVTQEYGGGICQISSTLFNAVEPCNVEIVEKHEHSGKIYYVPQGRDATISYGSLDFKFKNNNSYPLKIYAEANSENVTVRICKVENSGG